MKHSIIIRRHRPWMRLGLTAAVSAVLALSGWGLYRYTRQSTVADFEKATSERDRLLEERRSLSQQLRAARSDAARLRDEVAYLTQSKTIDGDACKSVKDSLAKIERETSSCREQLAFYRAMVAPKESRAGVRVQELKVRRTPAGWHFSLMLIQSVREEARIAGSAEVTIEGLQAARPASLKLSELVTAGDRNLLFSFKYFEEFGGDFKLPQGFKPLRAVVSLNPANDRPSVIDQYQWADIEAIQERSSD